MATDQSLDVACTLRHWGQEPDSAESEGCLPLQGGQKPHGQRHDCEAEANPGFRVVQVCKQGL